MKTVIIDYEMGNVRSIENCIRFIGGTNIEVTADPKIINSADCLILPGVGSFSAAMANLSNRGLISILNDNVLHQKKPVLGICLGMQLFFEWSNEKQKTKGLGWVPGHVEYIKPEKHLKVPHIGWNSLKTNQFSPIFDFLSHDKDFYFVHSLHAKCEEKYVLAKFEYGCEMVASVRKENIVGMQFHPEKSQKNGLLAMESFLDWAKKSVVKKHD